MHESKASPGDVHVFTIEIFRPLLATHDHSGGTDDDWLAHRIRKWASQHIDGSGTIIIMKSIASADAICKLRVYVARPEKEKAKERTATDERTATASHLG